MFWFWFDSVKEVTEFFHKRNVVFSVAYIYNSDNVINVPGKFSMAGSAACVCESTCMKCALKSPLSIFFAGTNELTCVFSYLAGTERGTQDRLFRNVR